MRQIQPVPAGRRMLDAVLTVGGALVLTLVFFLVLPLIQTISHAASPDLLVQSVDAAALPPPPPPPEPEPEKRPEEEKEPPPELQEEQQPLDLAELDLALSPGFGEGWLKGDFGLSFDKAAGSEEEIDALFALADLDQEPRAVYRANPTIDARMRKRMPATVHILFIVDQDGRVENPIVHSSTDSLFERSALQAVKQWRFEPGRRKGQPVRFRMKVPITFQ